MNKLNMFWVILLIYVMSFFLIVAVEVDNTVINEVEAVNYNGYFVKQDEDVFIANGFVYNHNEGCYRFQDNDNNLSFLVYKTIGYYFVVDNIEGSPVHYSSIEFSEDSMLIFGYWTIESDFFTVYYHNEEVDIIIYGLSNYGVSS